MLINKNKKYIAAAVIEKDGRVFIAQRTKEDCNKGKWEFPGGKVELGETLHECLKRELREELGIEVEVGEYLCCSCFEHKGLPFEMRAFRVLSFTGTIMLNEHAAMAWVKPSELAAYEMPGPDLPVVRWLQRNCSVELCYRQVVMPDRWFRFTFEEQMGNVGSDVERAIAWKKKGSLIDSNYAFYRALEQIDLTKMDPKNSGRLKEICRAREFMLDHFMYDDQYGFTDEWFQKYFYDFAYAAAIQRGR